MLLIGRIYSTEIFSENFFTTVLLPEDDYVFFEKIRQKYGIDGCNAIFSVLLEEQPLDEFKTEIFQKCFNLYQKYLEYKQDYTMTNDEKILRFASIEDVMAHFEIDNYIEAIEAYKFNKVIKGFYFTRKEPVV